MTGRSRTDEVRAKVPLFQKVTLYCDIKYFSNILSHRTTGCLDDRLLTMMTDTGFYVP